MVERFNIEEFKTKYLTRVFVSVLIILVPTWIHSQNPPASNYDTIIIDPSYNHTKWGIQPTDLVFKFAAFTTSFDSDDGGEAWGIPEWVAFEIKKLNGPEPPSSTPPSTWRTVDSMNTLHNAPNDATYKISGVHDLGEVGGNSRFDRGHMCPKDTADRVSTFAGRNSHTILNAVPQLHWQNNGIWKALEKKSTDWADDYNQVWVICGPVFFGNKPSLWLGQKGEEKAAVPDAIFKIIIRETNNEIETLSFIIPNIIEDKKAKFFEYLTSMGRIESLTGLTFMTTLPASQQSAIKLEHENLTRAKKRQAVNRW